MNDIINEFGYLKPGTSLEKEDSIRLLKVKPKYSGKDASDDEFFNTLGFTKDNSDVADYFNSYLDSPGFKRIIKNLNEWWESRHPYRKYYSNPDLGTLKWFNIAKRVEPNRYINKMSTVYSESIQDPTELQRFIIVGSHPTPYWVLPDYPEKLQHHPIAVLGHEYAHGKAPFSLFGATHFNPKSAQAEALDLNTNTKPGHDSRQLEKHADLWGLKYLLYKEGIYDSRWERDITIEEIQKLRKKYPNLRPFLQMTDEQLLFQLNHVAMNENKNKKLLAKTGCKLISKHQTGNRLIPKGQSGWVAYLNPKNWGVKDYVTDNFSQAFNLAEADGQKEFLWRGKRYAVKRADLTKFNELLEWFKNYINNYKLEDVLLDFHDSIDARTLGSKELHSNWEKIDSIFEEVMDNYSPEAFKNYMQLRDSLTNMNNIAKKYYEVVRKDKLKKVKDKTNNLRLDRFILTTLPDREWDTNGWYIPSVDSLYASNVPGVFVHELSHATGADLLKNLRPTKKALLEDARKHRFDFIWYLQSPREMGARDIQNLFLTEKGLPTSTYHMDKKHNLIQMK